MTEWTEKSQVLFSALVESFVDGEIAIDTEGYHKKGECHASVWITMEGHWS
jgi:hypothetical protein